MNAFIFTLISLGLFAVIGCSHQGSQKRLTASSSHSVLHTLRGEVPFRGKMTTLVICIDQDDSKERRAYFHYGESNGAYQKFVTNYDMTRKNSWTLIGEDHIKHDFQSNEFKINIKNKDVYTLEKDHQTEDLLRVAREDCSYLEKLTSL